MRLIDVDALITKLDEMISVAILADTEIHYALIRELVAKQPTIEPDELPPFEERTCDNCGSGDMFKYMHENKPSAPDNAAREFLLYILEQIPLDTLIAYAAKRKEKEDAGSKTD